MASTLRVLIVEDDENDALLLARQLRKGGLEVEFQRVDTEAAMAAACDARTWDVVISDVSMPRFTAAAALALVRQRQGDCPFIVVSGVIDEEMAVSLLRSGAHDFILKGRLARLVPAVERELREWHTRRARHEAEEARRVSEERYALAARGANDGIWDWDLVAGAVYLSPRWKGILGHGDDEIGTAPEEWLDRIHPDDRAGVRAGIAAHLAQEVPHLAVEHRLRHRDGGWRWVLARGVAVRHEDGTPCRMAGSLTDITAGKQAEQALCQAKDELEGALAAKTRFLAAASHDLRQPFQSMRLYQHMLAEKVVDPVQQRLAANLGKAMAAGEALLHALLDISTLDAGIVQVDAKDVRALPCVTAVAREFEEEARARNISLRVMGADDFIHTDPLLLGQIVRNLLSNAIRYTPAGGRVLVACRRRREELVIEVWDTGLGIPEDMQEAVFEDFIQVANPERDRRKGLGLGLGIARRTAKLLGCSLSLRSRPGRGSVFAIAFPRVAAADPPNVVRLPGNPGSRRQEPFRVLLIEDDTLQLMALQLVLEEWGYAVMAAPTAEEAFAALAGSAVLPGLIISDFRLPGEINGVQAVARICNEARRHIPAIIVTGDTAPERIKEAAATGCQLLHKPYDPAVLKATIDALMAPEAGSSPAPARRGSAAPPER